tara:strand:+ start:1192 stop:2016 length:825 start_codon:yes stop_codon:yes gene_type:complete
MNKIGIIGIGFVGNAIKSFFENKIETVCYDKFKDFNTLQDILTTDLLFLCLPTLFDNNKNEYDKSAILETCKYLNKMDYKGLVIIKSTVEPKTTDKLSKMYPKLKLIHNPEFLTARTAIEDFQNQKHIIIGNGPNVSDNDIENIYNFFKFYYPNANISHINSTESECIKLFCNSFGASKVMLFNEYYLLCNKIGIDFNKVRDIMLNNGWINNMHTQVPGPDGQLGFGGACFPKDTRALNSYMVKNNTPHNILNSVINECDTIRNNKLDFIEKNL